MLLLIQLPANLHLRWCLSVATMRITNGRRGSGRWTFSGACGNVFTVISIGGTRVRTNVHAVSQDVSALDTERCPFLVRSIF